MSEFKNRDPIHSLEGLTSEQHGALAMFSLAYHNTKGGWIEYLKQCWWTNKDEGMRVYVHTSHGVKGVVIGPELRQIRNRVGPKKLDDIRLIDVSQVFELVRQQDEGADPVFRFNCWFVKGGKVWEDDDIDALATLPIGHSRLMKPEFAAQVVIRRL